MHVEVARRPLGESHPEQSRKAASRDKTPGKSSNAENVTVPATVDGLLATMKVVPSAFQPVALAI